ncbi:hypothetical protein PQJ75_00795 [Rhodoplanes sp. TEM]|uniref:Uncharacterized protein n=1 Tax=Rhodoplanes tepidamans TaxID=200616 RepID=A0ABT5J6Y8_RHOTP|nr:MULTISPECIES: hypothetical protein [Rhodoplanes]MDC7784790.1 hypothetical protein [Rhodoplanes tepidamans]MDC7982257.1 hypothetical protein [Rhodoplanes sp. TEM]MDQ0356264.1 hypothetical protein [Rhodoplanes tepidamans]
MIDAHAEDYSEPFAAGKTDEFHLCFVCHMMVHCRFKNRDAWDRYRTAIREGKRSRPFHTRNFGRFSADFLDAPGLLPRAEYEQHEPPARRPLDEIDQRACMKETAPIRRASR